MVGIIHVFQSVGTRLERVCRLAVSQLFSAFQQRLLSKIPNSIYFALQRQFTPVAAPNVLHPYSS